MTGKRNIQISPDEFDRVAKEKLFIVQNPQSILDLSISSVLACRDHGLIVSWRRTFKEQMAETYNFSSVDLYYAIKAHIAQFHNSLPSSLPDSSSGPDKG